MKTPDKRTRLVESLIKDLREWRSKPESWGFFQFLAEKNFPWRIFRFLCDEFPRLEDEYEVTLSHLGSKWVMKGLREDKMATHHEKLMMKYLKHYDRPTYHEDLAAKQEREVAKALAMASVTLENYAEQELEEPYASLYKAATKDKPKPTNG